MAIVRIKFARVALCSVIALLVTACATPNARYPAQPPIELDATVQLNFSAEIPIGQDRVFIQNGHIVAAEAVDIYQVFCNLRMKRYQSADAPRMKIEPGTFATTRVRLYNDYVHRPVVYANNDDPFYYPSFGIDYRTEVYLQSAAQPDLLMLACTNHQWVYRDDVFYYPTRADFGVALGDKVRIH